MRRQRRRDAHHADHEHPDQQEGRAAQVNRCRGPLDAAHRGYVVAGEGWHEGVIGIVASRIKDKLHRPTFVFAASQAPGKEHELKGSGRSIPGFHFEIVRPKVVTMTM